MARAAPRPATTACAAAPERASDLREDRPPIEAQPTDASDVPATAPIRLVVDATVASMLGLVLLNAVLNIATLGLYRFWGRTRVRSYLWNHTAVLDDRFEYTGTGGELLRGFMRAMLLLIPFGVVVVGGYFVSSLFLPLLSPVLGGLLYLGTAFIGNAARYSARRYRLSRTRWRGIRGTQVGSPWTYGVQATGTMLLLPLTLGLYLPFRWARLTAFELNHTYFGDRALHFDGVGRDLFRPWVIAWLLLLPTLGLSWIWYQARVQRYLAAHLAFEDLRFAFPVTGGQLLRRSFGDLCLVVFTLGIGAPLIVLRRLRYFARHLQVTGTADFAAIAQGSAPAPATGEGLLDLFDIGDL